LTRVAAKGRLAAVADFDLRGEHIALAALLKASGREASDDAAKGFAGNVLGIKPGKSLVFTACALYARTGKTEKLVATGATLLPVVKSGVQA
jgi:hypothetical protein